MLEYYVERDCELMQINGLLDSKGYGVGLPKRRFKHVNENVKRNIIDSTFREPISSAILMLQEKTILTELKEKWWKEKRGGGECKGKEEKKTNELGLQNVRDFFCLYSN